MLLQIELSVKCVERWATERNQAWREAFCRLYRGIPDRCVVVVDETQIAGQNMVRRRGRAQVGETYETLAPDPRARASFSSTVSISWTRFGALSTKRLSLNHSGIPSACKISQASHFSHATHQRTISSLAGCVATARRVFPALEGGG